jgi:hypothetical protein
VTREKRNSVFASHHEARFKNQSYLVIKQQPSSGGTLMNKKILAAAIGAALVAGPLAAQADLKISGRIAADITSADGGIAMSDSGHSRLQFDASDDSGWYTRAATDLRGWFGGGANSGRDVYVGIKGGFGSIQAGRMAGAVKNIEGDPFIATFLEYRNNFVKGGAYGSSSFLGNMLQYANKFGDASIKIQYNPTDDAIAGPNGDLGASIKAKLAGANVFAGYNNQGNVTDGTYYKLGGDMSFGDIKAKLIYENDNLIVGDEARFVVGAEFKVGGGMVDISYADKGNDRTAAAYRIGFMKKASKKARWWVGYTQNGSNKTPGVVGDTATFGGGARVDF